MTTKNRKPACGILAAVAVCLALAGEAGAQTCAPLTPIVEPNFASTPANASVTNGPYWFPAFTTTANNGLRWAKYAGTQLAHSDDFTTSTVAVSGYNGFYQDVQGGVTGGSVLTFDIGWGNSSNTATFGARVEVEVLYNDVIYARFNTPRVGQPNTDRQAVDLNGAVLTVAPAWNSGPEGIANMHAARVVLPAGVPQSGRLTFRVRRNNGVTRPPTAGTDDVAVRNPVLLSPSLCLVKQSNGATGSFGFIVDSNADTVLTGGASGGIQSAATVTTTASGTPVAYDAWPGATAPQAGISPILVLDMAQPLTITESSVPAGFTLASLTCSGNGIATYDLATRSATITGIVPQTAPTTCTFVNQAATLQLAKAWGANSTAGDTVSIGAATGGGNDTVAFTAMAPTAANSGAPVLVEVGSTITLPAEAGANAGNYTTTLACTGGHTLSGTDGKQVNTLTITSTNPAVCTYTNAASAGSLTITKTVTGAPATHVAWSFPVTVACATPTATYTGAIAVAANATTGTTTISGIAAGSTSCAITEGAKPAAPAGYTWGTETYTQPVATAMPAGGTRTGAITNPLTADAIQADLRITKTNTPGVNGNVDQTGDSVTAGAPTVYTITVTNAGPGAADGATVVDTPGAGLGACMVTGCTPSGGAVCPATPAAILTSTGAAVPTFPANATVVFTVQCTVP